MNKDLTVLSVILLALLLEGVGAWHFFPALSGAEGWAASDSVVLAAALIACAAVLSYFSTLILRRIASRRY
ncbi:MAG TPA: hypothetical protein VMM38_00405 [Aridibacter sp.]|nr:hypothetical protein [Aridibacter sp.]